ncbi:MAG TPA: ABC transporter permease [Thermoanaerobaculia bacterium]|jgi:putative ABC transport system permease protein
MKPVLTRLDRAGHYGVAYHNFMRWRDDNHTFAALAAVRARTYHFVSGEGSGERLDGSEVSPSYFEVLGVEPARGRRFLPADTVPGSCRVAIVSHALWQRNFVGDSEVAGAMLRLDGEPHEVVGVMPPASPDRALGWEDLWTPLAVDEAAALETPLHGFGVLGRLDPGVTVTEARSDLDAVARRLEDELPAWNRGWGVEMHPIRWWITGDVERPLLLLLWSSVRDCWAGAWSG